MMSFLRIPQNLFIKKITNNSLALSSFKIWSKSAIITSEMVGLRLKVHNGKDFILLPILDNMIGFRLGEFIWTRARYEFKKKKKKKK